ncbi:BadF/BadG/BcrA/BcrD ATPase family protein [Ferrimonas pelagia]|uniref:BadF/BadG/BcrA/BcrD ATPase family protein n=2 Tax=Ferrimonas pelagia TaxID=1177826 RepID=A0ABP9ECQ4_9GAMM
MMLGIDGGGSKCRAVLYHPNGGILGSGLSGAANPVNGLAAAQDSIVDACEQALTVAGYGRDQLQHCVVGAGLAGVNLPSCMAAMTHWQHPFSELYVTTDLHIACLGAHGRKDGAIIISGTGSCGYLSQQGHGKIYGGHGFPQGDKGSGAWFGLMTVQRALEACDGLGPQTWLTEGLSRHFRSSDPLFWIEQLAGQRSTAYARLAGVLFQGVEHQDVVAQKILQQGVDYLTRLATRLLDDGAPRLALLGGLGPLLIPHLDEAVQRALCPAQATPEMGAVFFAQDSMGLI